jgi:hypothetical protein
MKIQTKILLLVVVAVFFAVGCKYDWVIPEEVPDIDPNEDVIKFSEHILPIFTDNNNCTACHDGSQIPDLRTDKAYNSLNSTRYINKTSPEESRIYSVPHPDTDGHSQKKYSATQAAYIKAWIQQGAENN